jgi:hypothetical protein
MRCFNCPFYRQPDGSTGTTQFVPLTTIEQYLGRTVETYIQGFGRIRAYILSLNKSTGMVQLIILTPWGGQQYFEVYYQDMIGISPVIPGAGGGMGGGPSQGGWPGQGEEQD